MPLGGMFSQLSALGLMLKEIGPCSALDLCLQPPGSNADRNRRAGQIGLDQPFFPSSRGFGSLARSGTSYSPSPWGEKYFSKFFQTTSIGVKTWAVATERPERKPQLCGSQTLVLDK